MRIICTDRGQHVPRLLLHVYPGEECPDCDKRHLTGAKIHRRLPAGLPPAYLLDGERVPGWHDAAWEFQCPSCPRHVLVNEDRFEQIYEGARRVGLEAFDTSYLE